MDKITVQRDFNMSCKTFACLMIWPILLVAVIMGFAKPASAQEENQWTPKSTIPGYHLEAEPPILIPDQSGTIHAVSSQILSGAGEQRFIAIAYNRWMADSGWTPAVDVLLSPFKEEARLLGATLGQDGMLHVVFFGGNNQGANIYYSKAPAEDAADASYWSNPKLVGPNAGDPESGGIASDGKGNLLVVYSGYDFGPGWYMVTSSDNGKTWSDVTMLFPIYNSEYTPFFLSTYLGNNGLLHATWSVQDNNNHGLAVYYANFDFDSMSWSDPVLVAERGPGVVGLGTQQPVITEYKDTIFIFYYDGLTGRLYNRLSSDKGQSWSEAVAPFPQIGLNGPGAFVVDSNETLHFFWSQRLSGSPDLHAVWHSVWQEDGWSEPESVVEGPVVKDKVGLTAFDPLNISIAIGEGNKALVTWRSDYASRGNGVWYSSAVLDAPELPTLPLPTVKPVLEEDNAAGNLAGNLEPTPEAVPEFGDRFVMPEVGYSNPAEDIFTSLIPGFLLILLVVIYRQISHNRRR